MPHLPSPLRRAASALLSLGAALVLLGAPPARAQHSVDLAVTYTQQQSKFVGSAATDTFTLRGAAADLGYGLWHHLGITMAANGLSVSDAQQSIDIQQSSFLIGPRYTQNFGHVGPTASHRRVGIFIDGKFGYTFATNGLYPSGTATLSSHASGLTYSGGGGINLHLYRKLDVRLAQVDLVQSHLPNGGSNEQNNLRLSAGVNLHFGS